MLSEDELQDIPSLLRTASCLISCNSHQGHVVFPKIIIRCSFSGTFTQANVLLIPELDPQPFGQRDVGEQGLRNLGSALVAVTYQSIVLVSNSIVLLEPTVEVLFAKSVARTPVHRPCYGSASHARDFKSGSPIPIALQTPRSRNSEDVDASKSRRPAFHRPQGSCW